MTLKSKVYFQDTEVFNILGERFISGFNENTIAAFSGRLQKYIIYLKKENKDLLIKIYEKIFKTTTTNINTIENKLIKLIEETEKNKDEKIIRKIIGNITISSKDLNEQEEIINKWFKEISGNIKGYEMGFLAKK